MKEYWEKHKRLPTDVEEISDVKSNEKNDVKMENKGIIEIVDNPYIKLIK
jgi:hypothetical protein